MRFFDNATEQLGRSAIGEWVRKVVLHTPRHAIHWYSILAVSIVVTLLLVFVALFVAPSTESENSANEEAKKDAVSIKQEDLQKAIDILKTREAEYKSLLANPPQVIDPRR